MDNTKEKKVIDILTIIDIILGVFIALPKIHFQIQIIIGAIWLIIFLTLLYHYSKDHEYINFIEYLKFSHVDTETLDSVTIKSKKDLKEKLQRGLNDIKENKVYSLDEVFSKIDNI